MNTIVFNKLSNQVLFEEKAKEVERSSRNYLEVIDGQHPDLLSNNQTIKDNSANKHKRSGSRQSGGKVRHKRQALQDMARPLKQWLYKHRDNPYPTKTEKILLALGSQMTLVQRLLLAEHTGTSPCGRFPAESDLRDPGVWTAPLPEPPRSQGEMQAVQQGRHGNDYLKHPNGENPSHTQTGAAEFSKPMYQSVIKKEGAVVGAGLRADTSLGEDYVSPPKYKSSLLHRYLNDSLHHVMASNGVMDSRKRNHSGSFSSNEYDDELLSPSSSETEANFVYRADHSQQRNTLSCADKGIAVTLFDTNLIILNIININLYTNLDIINIIFCIINIIIL
ncbi:hypothetical protein JZ751_022050, partial [Albula glossodonta]